jgi:hypothetical protein
MLLVVTTVEFFVNGDTWGRWAVLPKAAQYLPEILGGIALLIVASLGAGNRFRYVRPEYWLFFGGIAAVVLCGVIVNRVESGTVFAGLRTYLRALPWFFIPAVYGFSDKQIREQLRLLLAICLIQVPLAVQQLMSTRSGFAGDIYTGDWISGTMLVSSTLSIFLVGAICIATGLAIRRRITGRQFLMLFILLLLPTTINETKGTLLLLPLGLVLAFFSATRPKVRLKYAVVLVLLTVGFLATFVPIYNHLIAARAYPKEIAEYFTDPQKLESYMKKGVDIGATETAGRYDSVVVTSSFIARDPVTLAFGLGIGNASNSALGKGFTGHYFDVLKPFLVTSFARVVSELGAIGFALLVVIYWLIFSDARIVARSNDGLLGALAAGWTGVAAIMLVALFYKDVVTQVPLSFVFWYLSGLLAAERARASAAPGRR